MFQALRGVVVAIVLSLVLVCVIGQELESCRRISSRLPRNRFVTYNNEPVFHYGSDSSRDVCSTQCLDDSNQRVVIATMCCGEGFLAQTFGIFRIIFCSAPVVPVTTEAPTTTTPQEAGIPSCEPAPPVELCPSSAVRSLDTYSLTGGVCSYGCYQRRRSFAGGPVGNRKIVTRYQCSEGYTMMRERVGRYICECTSTSCGATPPPTSTTQQPSTTVTVSVAASTSPPATVSTPTTSSQLPICFSTPRVFTNQDTENAVCTVSCRRRRTSFGGFSVGPIQVSEHRDCCTGYTSNRNVNGGRRLDVTYTCERV